jgi:hypothetical protein
MSFVQIRVNPDFVSVNFRCSVPQKQAATRAKLCQTEGERLSIFSPIGLKLDSPDRDRGKKLELTAHG